MKYKEEIVKLLNLQKHREGGYFSEIYRCTESLATTRVGKERNLLTSIYYMLTKDSPIGYFHANQSDIVHYFHAGSPITYYIIYPDGRLEKEVLGLDIKAGCRLQLVVKGGCWKASVLTQGEFGLIGEAVAPGFDYRDAQMAEPDKFKKLFPHLWDELSRYVRV